MAKRWVKNWLSFLGPSVETSLYLHWRECDQLSLWSCTFGVCAWQSQHSPTLHFYPTLAEGTEASMKFSEQVSYESLVSHSQAKVNNLLLSSSWVASPDQIWIMSNLWLMAALFTVFILSRLRRHLEIVVGEGVGCLPDQD